MLLPQYNCENGGPAPESLTGAIFERTKAIAEYRVAEGLAEVDLGAPGVHDLGGGFAVEVFDGTEAHIALLREIFDFTAIKALLARPDFRMVYDGMHGVAGNTARRVFVDLLGAQVSNRPCGGSSPPERQQADGWRGAAPAA